MQQARCLHCKAPSHTPRALRAIPLPSVHEATHRSSCLPSLIVAGLFVGMALLSELVPAVAGAIASVMP
jgi:hypothetical protein